MMKIQKTSKLARLSVAAVLLSTSIAAAQEVPAGAAEHTPAHVAEPVPVETPAVVETAPVVPAAPVVVAVVETAPVAKAAESTSATIAGTKISLYGRLELNSAFETSTGDSKKLWSVVAPSPAKNADGKKITPEGRTSLSVARTRFGINLEGPSKENEPSIKGRFEADFSGADGYYNFNGSSGFRIRQSWGSVNFKDIGLTLLFGQTDDVVTPLDPPAVHPSSFNGTGNLGNRRPQIRVTETIGPIELAVAATHDRTYGYTPQTDKKDPSTATGTAITDSLPSSMPGFQGRLGVKLPASWAGEKANLAVGVGGLYASNEAAYPDSKNDYDSPEPSYMFGADLSLPIIDILTLTGEFFTGQNLSRYGNGSLDQKRAYHEDGGIKSIGWWGGLAAKLPSNISAGLGAGAENLDKKSQTAGKIEGNMFIFANLAYNFTSAAKVTFEFTNFSSDYSKQADGTKVDSGSMNRFELNYRYDFK